MRTPTRAPVSCVTLCVTNSSVHLPGGHTTSPLDADVAFATALEPEKINFFQAFMAAAPQHPILKEALRVMLAYYEGTHKLHGWMGTSTLKDAYDAVPAAELGTIRWLHESQLKPRQFPELKRQKGTGKQCNYVVHDERDRKPYFWSRIVGVSRCS